MGVPLHGSGRGRTGYDKDVYAPHGVSQSFKFIMNIPVDGQEEIFLAAVRRDYFFTEIV